jgi:hypothetical protein
MESCDVHVFPKCTTRTGNVKQEPKEEQHEAFEEKDAQDACAITKKILTKWKYKKPQDQGG